MTTGAQPVVVVGAGLAGLTCAAELHGAGVPVLVLEAEGEVGGRVRTERHPDGFLLDRGYQILLTAYPAQKRQVDLAALDVAPFDNGLLVWTGKRLVPLADPFRHPTSIVRDLSTRIIPVADKLRLARLAAEALRGSWQSAAAVANERDDDRSTEAALRARGFSDAFIDRIARPFWGGVFLESALSSSEGPFLFTLKMFLQGRAVLPAAGVGAMPAALAARLPAGGVRLNARVTALVRDGARITGVRLGDETISAAAVVVATDPPTARDLTGIEAIPTEPRGCVTVYLARAVGDGEFHLGKRLVVDGTGQARVVNIAPLSTVQPTYAPPDQHLIAAVLLGDEAQAADDATLRAWATADVARMLGESEVDWRVVHIVRVPFSLYAQPPGIFRRLPDATTGTRDLFLASDATVDASANGAFLSGEAAARAVRAALGS